MTEADGRIIDPRVYASADALHPRFAAARPFPHVVIDGFFTPAFAARLAAEFPAASATPNPYGAAGLKAAQPDLPAAGGAYREVHAYLASPAFSQWASRVTGIAGLIYDEQNFGGGTHENFDGRDLRPHVDFNYHPISKLHRRVNVIVYLNRRWEPEWGGSIALYGDPRDPFDERTEYAPTFNRCIVFETSERSWHGFERIVIPPEHRGLTRRSLSIYLYSRDRAETETHPEHTTFFVPRPLPARFAEGRTLSRDDVADLGELVGQRDRLIALYQQELARREPDAAQAARLRIRLAEEQARRLVPTTGFVMPRAGADGMDADGWCGNHLAFEVLAERAVTRIAASVQAPSVTAADARFRLSVNGIPAVEAPARPGRNELAGPAAIAAGAIALVRLDVSATVNLKARGLSADERDLGFLIERVTFEH